MFRNLGRPPKGGLKDGHGAGQLKPREEVMKSGRSGKGTS